MKNILVLGAGRSATSLIDYLIRRCSMQHTTGHVRVGDYDLDDC